MQAEAKRSEILHDQPETRAQRLDVIVHSDDLFLGAFSAATQMQHP